jgi:hypothetical protein
MSYASTSLRAAGSTTPSLADCKVWFHGKYPAPPAVIKPGMDAVAWRTFVIVWPALEQGCPSLRRLARNSGGQETWRSIVPDRVREGSWQ